MTALRPRSPRLTFPSLPSAPLASAIEAIQFKHPQKSICKDAGIADRTFRDWRDGSRPTCQFDTADTALTRLGLLWWEVWHEGTVRRYGIVATTYAWRLSSGRDRKSRPRREPVGVRCYWDLGPDLETLALVAYAFTGEHPDLGEQLEFAA